MAISSTAEDPYIQQIYQKFAQAHTPLHGSIELTARCNLECVHCYLGDQETIRQNRHNELNTDQWLKIIDDIADAGCLYLLISGGDPLLRRDFAEIYRYAKNKGLLITIFTNGTVFTDKIIQLFKQYPPLLVEISVYAATETAYEEITKVKHSYQRCIQGIERLLENNIKTALKTVVMKPNSEEFYAIENIAKKYNIKFRFDTGIFSCFTGDKEPLDLRVSPKKAVEIELSDVKRLQEWTNIMHTRKNKTRDPNQLYHCGAARTAFHIDANGMMKPCLMTHSVQYDLKSGDFNDGWHRVLPQIHQRKPDPDLSCNTCDKRHMCTSCPAFSELEHGVADKKVDYLCEITHERYNQVIAKNYNNRI